MGNFFDDTMQGLLEAVEIEKRNIPLTQKENMPAPTFIISDEENKLIDEMVDLRKRQHLSQKQLAEITGNKQQVISRIERKENSPSLKTFCNILNALGYKLEIKRGVSL